MRSDPAKAYAAQGVTGDPVGTLDELRAHNLPTRVFGACAEPSNDETIHGCKQWLECTMSYRGMPVAEGGGPRNHCWERIKSAGNGGGIVRAVAPCFWGIKQQDIVRRNDEILQVIADEGDEYEMLTTVADPLGGRNNDGFLKWDTKLVKNTVQPFTRIGQEQKLATHELRASIVERERERLKNEHAAKALGLKGNDTPIDKRVRRSGGGSQKEG